MTSPWIERIDRDLTLDRAYPMLRYVGYALSKVRSRWIRSIQRDVTLDSPYPRLGRPYCTLHKNFFSLLNVKSEKTKCMFISIPRFNLIWINVIENGINKRCIVHRTLLNNCACPNPGASIKKMHRRSTTCFRKKCLGRFSAILSEELLTSNEQKAKS